MTPELRLFVDTLKAINDLIKEKQQSLNEGREALVRAINMKELNTAELQEVQELCKEIFYLSPTIAYSRAAFEPYQACIANSLASVAASTVVIAPTAPRMKVNFNTTTPPEAKPKPSPLAGIKLSQSDMAKLLERFKNKP